MTENANERFERLAAAFHKATGRRFLAPGKDDPLAREEGEVERALRWAMFVEGVQYGEAARAAPREPGGDMVRLTDVMARIAEASLRYGGTQESWLVGPRQLTEDIRALAARPDAGDGTGEP